MNRSKAMNNGKISGMTAEQRAAMSRDLRCEQAKLRALPFRPIVGESIGRLSRMIRDLEIGTRTRGAS